MADETVNMQYVTMIQIWLLKRYEPEEAYKIWKESSEELSQQILDDYQLGQSGQWNEEVYNNAISYFDQYAEYLLGIREQEGEGEA